MAPFYPGFLGAKPGAVHLISEFSQLPFKPGDRDSEKSENKKLELQKS